MERRALEGVASVYDQPSEDFGGFREIIAPGAFRNAIEQSDVRLLFNHDKNLILGRTTSGTLELWEDRDGLHYRAELGDQTYATDLLIAMQRGDVSQSSFGFTVRKDDVDWEERDGTPYRIIRRIERLFDVSPVTYAAYPQTEVAVRHYQEYQRSQDSARAFAARLFYHQIRSYNASID